MGNRRFGLYRSYATITLQASSACNDSAENWADARAPSCFKARKSSRTARSRRHGLSYPDRGQVVFPGCAAKAALKATSEKGPTERWIIGLNDVCGQTPINPARSIGKKFHHGNCSISVSVSSERELRLSQLTNATDT